MGTTDTFRCAETHTLNTYNFNLAFQIQLFCVLSMTGHLTRKNLTETPNKPSKVSILHLLHLVEAQ